MWIWLCDDDLQFCKTTLEYIESIKSRTDQIVVCNSGTELLELAYSARRPIDLILLDIKMPGLNGLDTARELREFYPSVVIIIVTDYKEYALDGYDIEAISYLLKPLDADRLRSEIERARQKHLKADETLHVNTKEASYFIPLKDIIFIESYERTLIVHTASSKYRYYAMIGEVADKLGDKGFFHIYKSYIVNLSYIDYVDKASKTAVLNTGKKIPISPQKIKFLLSAFVGSGRG